MNDVFEHKIVKYNPKYGWLVNKKFHKIAEEYNLNIYLDAVESHIKEDCDTYKDIIYPKFFNNMDVNHQSFFSRKYKTWILARYITNEQNNKIKNNIELYKNKLKNDKQISDSWESDYNEEI